MRGVPVYFVGDPGPDQTPPLRQRIADALQLVEDVDGRHYRRLHSDGCSVIVFGGSRAHFAGPMRAIVLGPQLILEKVPDREDLVAHYRAQLEGPWWTPQQRYARMVRYFEELGAPQWIIQVCRFLARPRSTA